MAAISLATPKALHSLQPPSEFHLFQSPPNWKKIRRRAPGKSFDAAAQSSDAPLASKASFDDSLKLKRLLTSKELPAAMDVYRKMKSRGTAPGVLLESMLIDALMKSNRFTDAFQVFDAMPERNVVTWTSMVSGCVKNGYGAVGFSLFGEMLESGVLPNDFAFSATLQACTDLADLELGEQMHSLIIRSGFGDDCRIQNCLIDFYSRCGMMDRAKQVFDGMVELDLVSFTALISGLCRSSLLESAFRVLDQMIRQGFQPNEHTVSSILTASGLLLGKQIHGYMMKGKMIENAYCRSALIEFYSRISQFEQAKLVFRGLDLKNVVVWSSMISCCLRSKQVGDAWRIFREMICSGVEPNEFTISTLIGSCGSSHASVALGRQLHCVSIKRNFMLDNRVANAMLTMYARNGRIEDLERVFDKIEEPDIVSWTSVISGYFQNEFEQNSIKLLSQMHRAGYTPNEYGISSGLSSCANLALLDQGKQLHSLGLKLGCDLTVCTGNALVNMYAKCGCIEDAKLAFQSMPSHDIVSWNLLIHGYANHGHGREALEVFEEMLEKSCSKPDDSTFLAVLVACSHVGYINETFRYLERMKDEYDVEPSVSHYTCMIDMMGRAGRLTEAFDFISQMPQAPDIVIWKTLLGWCRMHRSLELGKFAAQKIFELSLKDSASYVLMSNLYALHGEWQNAERMRRKMEEEEVWKEAGWSWIEIKNKVHKFVARDESHPEFESIQQMLVNLSNIMKAQSYLPEIKFLSLEW